jgi:type III secretory pathway component EscV
MNDFKVLQNEQVTKKKRGLLAGCLIGCLTLFIVIFVIATILVVIGWNSTKDTSENTNQATTTAEKPQKENKEKHAVATNKVNDKEQKNVIKPYVEANKIKGQTMKKVNAILGKVTSVEKGTLLHGMSYVRNSYKNDKVAITFVNQKAVRIKVYLDKNEYFYGPESNKNAAYLGLPIIAWYKVMADNGKYYTTDIAGFYEVHSIEWLDQETSGGGFVSAVTEKKYE